MEHLPGLPLLSDIEQLGRLVSANESAVVGNRNTLLGAGQLYCPTCRRFARVSLTFIGHTGTRLGSPYLSDEKPYGPQFAPSAWLMRCVQCHAEFAALVFKGPSGSQVAVFSSVAGGLATPHTPAAVAYYLDQGHRAQSAGANSAAVVMFRSALEHVLHGHGYTQGTCGKRINDLESDLGKGEPRAPRWARDLTPDDLRLLKELGDGAAHANDGDITKQSTLDTELLVALSLTFAALLDLAYERPHAEEARRARLAAAASAFRKAKG
jgi:hypothetical protein